MSIEIEGQKLQFEERVYTVYPLVCDEHQDQLDSIRICYGLSEVACLSKKQATEPLHHAAIAVAEAALDGLIWDNDGMVIDDSESTTA